MKKTLLDATKSYYKANLHSHSTESDGVMTPAQVKEKYKSNEDIDPERTHLNYHLVEPDGKYREKYQVYQQD